MSTSWQKKKRLIRSRGGCAVCKSKRVSSTKLPTVMLMLTRKLKCDEAQPSCSRCERLGITCPGYKRALKWSLSSTADFKRHEQKKIASEQSADQRATFQPQLEQAGHDVPDPFGSEFLERLAAITEAENASIFDINDLGLSWPTEGRLFGTAGHYQGQAPETLFAFEAVSQAKDEIWQTSSVQAAIDGSWRQESFALAANAPTMGQALHDHTTVLVEYYFKEVCGMMSCYDSQLNPYRTTISSAWSGSPSLYYVTQSMAAACLSEVSPRLGSLVPQLQSQAISCLSQEVQERQVDTASLLALVMLGMSLSWHDPGQVGHLQFKVLTHIIQPQALDDNISPITKQKRVFFYNSLVYWQMLLSFVTDVEPMQGVPATHQPKELRLPHPQTGIGVEVQILVARVGSLVRRERKRILSHSFASKHDVHEAARSILEAERLQSQLCNIQMPYAGAVADSGDELTPVDHLLKVAEAYRCIGLLQLYRNFPVLLSSHMYPEQPPREAFSDLPLHVLAVAQKNAWQTRFALHVIDLIKDIPLSSRSRSIQPLLLVSICSELSLGHDSLPVGAQSPTQSTAIGPQTRSLVSDLDILCARRFVISRLSEFEHMLAARPIRQMLVLCKETWDRMDRERQDVYWMDVMMEKGYETLMG